MSKANLATQRVLQAVTNGDYGRADRILTAHGQLIGRGECGIRYYRIGDDVICVRSTTQVDWAGKLSSEPRFHPPEHMTEVQHEANRS